MFDSSKISSIGSKQIDKGVMDCRRIMMPMSLLDLAWQGFCVCELCMQEWLLLLVNLNIEKGLVIVAE